MKRPKYWSGKSDKSDLNILKNRWNNRRGTFWIKKNKIPFKKHKNPLIALSFCLVFIKILKNLLRIV